MSRQVQVSDHAILPSPPLSRETLAGFITSRASSGRSADTQLSTNACPSSEHSSCIMAAGGASMHLQHMSLASTMNSTSSATWNMVQDVPSSIFYNYPSCSSTPAARWAHSACCVGIGTKAKTMVVFGGIGHTTYADLWMLDTQSMQWRGTCPRIAASPKDRPGKTMAHAAAAIGNCMFVFGGQQGRKLTNKLFVLEVSDTYSTWRRLSNNTLPSARAGHAMVALNDTTIFMFGGQGKKLTNDLHQLNPVTGEFTELKPSGRPPAPRRGMSLVHVEYMGGSLICFGGTSGSSIDNALSVYSLQRNEWSHPQQQGQAPSARTNHSAVLIAPCQMLVFGGCNAQGTFFNDAYVLDTATFTWHRPKQLNSAPAPRYHHSCCHINGRTFLYGGINAKQTFDNVVVLDTDFSSDMGLIADELHMLLRSSSGLGAAGGGGGRPAAAAGGGGPAGLGAAVCGDAGQPREPCGISESSVSTGLIRVQLQDLLYKRNMEEIQAHASHRVDAAEKVLEGLRREEARAWLLTAEAEAEAARAGMQAKEAEVKATRDAAALAALRAEHDATLGQLAQRDAEAESTRKMHQGLVKELGLVASRYARLQQQTGALVLQRTRSEAESKPPPVTACPSAPLSSIDSCDSSSSVSLPRQQMTVQQLMASGLLTDGGGGFDPLYSASDASCYSGSSAFHQSTVCATELVSVLGGVEAHRDRLAAEVAALGASLSAAQAEHQRLECRLSPEALQGLPLRALQAVETELECGLRAVREAVMLRRISDAAAAEFAKAASENRSPVCSICLERPRGLVFNCGHQSCGTCGSQLPECPFCRLPITARIKVFDA